MKDPRIGLAISTYRQDATVCALLDLVQRECSDLFCFILIVDSQGSGAIAAHIKERGYSNVVLRDCDSNVGSAGNLALRLELSADEGLDYVYTVNHDGVVDRDTVTKLVEFVAANERVGAAYPMRYMRGRNRYDFTGTIRLPMPFHLGDWEDSKSPIPVYWASSNGALYSLAPVREGLLPWGDLWMGWEDMGYGWLLERRGWKQVLVPGTCFDDNYEFSSQRVLGRPIVIANKPAWYAYYGTRNLILVARRTESTPTDYLGVAARIAVEVGLTTVFKKDKLQRLRYIAAGFRDGVTDRAGKWRVP